MPANEELAVGDVLDDKYVIEEMIGRGGMGAVYRARHVDLGSRRAIKIMRRDLAQDASFVRRFRNEPRLAEGVRHPNVVSVYDFSTLDDGTSYIVWEYVEGDTLAELLARGNDFAYSDVVDLVEQVGNGLSAVHEKGILHRDVSPDNIMICTDERGDRNVKLLDFGVAKGGGIPGETPADASILFGKIGYASPEQMGILREDELLDARTDVFSLAAVAYTMLTGESPFRTESLQAFVHDLIIAPESEVKARYLEPLSDSWRAPLARALARDRKKRPATTKAFVTEVKEATRSTGLEGSQPLRAEPRARSRRALHAAAVLTGAAVVAVAIGTIERARQPEAERASAGTESVTENGPPQGRGQVTRDELVDRSEPSIPGPMPMSDTFSELPEVPMSAVPQFQETETSPPIENARATPQQTPVSMRPDTSLTEEARVDSNPDKSPDAELKARSQLDDETTPDPSDSVLLSSPAPPEPQPEAATPIIEPRLVFKKEPVYTPMARRRKIEGDVVLKAVITPQGNVTDVEVVRSLPHLDGAAIEAARQWKFEPAVVDGVAVSREMQLTVTFRLTP